MRPPDFLCIGAQKAGTTWVHTMLFQSNGVFVPPVKESNFLLELNDRDREWARDYRMFQVGLKRTEYLTYRLALSNVAELLDQIEHFGADTVDERWYGRLFQYARIDQVAGEICPSYLTLATRQNIRHAIRINPDVRALVLVRDPVERLWSHIRMEFQYGLLCRDVDELLLDTQAMANYLNFSDYARAIPRRASALKHGHLMLALHDDIERRPRELFEDILGFLGAKPERVRGYGARVNGGQERAMTPSQRRRIYELVMPQFEYLRGTFPEAVERWVRRHEQLILRPGLRSA